MKIPRLETNTQTAVVYLEERLVDPPANLSFTKVTAPLEKAAMIWPVTTELANDAPAINHWGRERFSDTLDSFAVAKVMEKTDQRFKVRPLETNRHAIKRATKAVRKAGGLEDIETYRVSDKKTVVGAFSDGVLIWTKGEPQVDATNQHQDFFQEGLIALRFEQPVAVSVFRPDAFGVVRTRRWWRAAAARVRRAFVS